jgi:hypothetical protein
VNNWNEERKTRATELKLLSELLDNLEVDRDRFQTKADNTEEILNSKHVIAKVIKEELPWHDSLYTHFSNFNGRPTYSQTNVAFKSIENWGIMNLSNDTLRKQITHFYEVETEGFFTVYDYEMVVLVDIKELALSIDFRSFHTTKQITPYNYQDFIKKKDFGKLQSFYHVIFDQTQNYAYSMIKSMDNLIKNIKNEIQRL